MDFSPKLLLPYLLPNQAQKHVTVNESLQRLDSLVQLSVVSSEVTSEPPAPEEGDCYILPNGATGSNWTGSPVGAIAVYMDAYWRIIPAQEGWRAYDASTSKLLVHTETGWQNLTPDQAPEFGVNTTADPVNRLAVKSDAELLSHDDVTPGSGDARKIINKAATNKTASLILQENYAAKAEIGLTGDNNLNLKVHDGNHWHTGAVFDQNTGIAMFPNGVAHAQTRARQHSLILMSGGDGDISVYRNDTPRPQNPRTYSIASTSGAQVTLMTAEAGTVFLNTFMQGVCLLRVWNISKTPAQSAWIRQTNGPSELEVTDPAAIASWAAGEMLQVGDPEDITPNRCIALDISPMLQNQLGAVFHQAGLLLKIGTIGTGQTNTGLDVSPNGQAGSFNIVQTFPGGLANFGQVTTTTTVPSPVSSSNLLFIREHDHGGQAWITLISVLGIYV